MPWYFEYMCPLLKFKSGSMACRLSSLWWCGQLYRPLSSREDPGVYRGISQYTSGMALCGHEMPWIHFEVSFSVQSMHSWTLISWNNIWNIEVNPIRTHQFGHTSSYFSPNLGLCMVLAVPHDPISQISGDDAWGDWRSDGAIFFFFFGRSEENWIKILYEILNIYNQILIIVNIYNSCYMI